MLSPLDGEVVAVNEEAARSPEIVNEDPLSEGWLLKVEMSTIDEFDDLLTEEEYEDFLTEEQESEEDED